MEKIHLKPKKGKIVRYVHKLEQCNASEPPEESCAIITRVHKDDEVDLFVMHSHGIFLTYHVPHSSDENKRGTWHWADIIGDH